MATPKQVKLALVGCGGIAQAHWYGIQNYAPHITVTAAIDTDSERAEQMAKQAGAQPFTSLDDALAHGDFSAVDIMLPHNLHETVAIQAFEAGKHVVLEKPMSISLASCDRILAAAQQAGAVFMVAEQSEFWPEAVKIRELLKDGTIGNVITASAFFGSPAQPSPQPKPWRYINDIAGGGLCIDGGAHWIRPLRMWFGEIDEVVAVTGHPLAEMEGESLARVLIRFESGLVALFDALRAGSFMGPGEEFRIRGTEGELLVEWGKDGRLLQYSNAYPDGKVLLNNKAEGRAAAFGYELHDFSLAVLEDKPLEAGPEYSLGELRTAFAIYRSVESRQWEKVWD